LSKFHIFTNKLRPGLLFTISLTFFSLALGMHAQTVPASRPEATPATNAAPEFVPQGLAQLAQHASWHSDFNFDRSMLSVMSKLDNLDAETRHVVAQLSSVTVHTYRYKAPATYAPAELDSIRSQYAALGWKHIVSKHGKIGPDEVRVPGSTDLWIHLDGVNVAGVAVLVAEPSNITLVMVNGNISTVDLLKLRGHFGIPKFDADDLPK